MGYFIPRILSSSQGLTIRQQYPIGSVVPGKRSDVVVDRAYSGVPSSYKDVDPDRASLQPGALVEYALEGTADTGGLFEPKLHLNEQKKACHLNSAQIRIGAGIAWTLSLTNGLGGGAAGAVDDPAGDIVIATGTGNALVANKVEIPSGCSIRFVSAANTAVATASVDVQIVPITDNHSRGNS